MSPAGNADNVGNKVREVRLQRGWTQEQLGEAVGLTRQSVIAIEKGRFTPSIHSALSLAEALGVSIADLFWLETDAPPGGEQ